jgi:hypothetical protein
VKNKCSTVVVAIVYVLIKYKWKIHRTLEYINSKKWDIEITKSILKDLSLLEKKVEYEFLQKKSRLRQDW